MLATQRFFLNSGLCSNLDKCTTAGIGVLKNINVALCCMNLTKKRKYKNCGSTCFL